MTVVWTSPSGEILRVCSRWFDVHCISYRAEFDAQELFLVEADRGVEWLNSIRAASEEG